MRDYAKIAPQFWIGQTGKKIRKLGAEAQVIALYLMSSPHANMIGMYHIPIAYISADTGIPFEGASKALRGVIEAGLCGYDDEAEVVWLYEMAKYQVGEQLKAGDKQCAGVQNAYDNVPGNRFLAGFHDKYASAFHMKNRREYTSPFEAPSKPLRSQEQEQEQEREQEQEKNNPAKGTPSLDVVEPMFEQFWDAYPKKVGKEAARKAWSKVKSPAATLGLVLSALRWQSKSEQWAKESGQYIPNPATYINQGRWNDQPPAQNSSTLSPAGEATRQAAERWVQRSGTSCT